MATMLTTVRALLVLLLCVLASGTEAANYPCSGSKGGISHCAGTRFVCRDGSISGSKRVCTAADAATPTLRPLVTDATPSRTDCACRANRYCTGPRGGRYCLSDSGKKSYLRD